ncbi:MAG: hypothetical protein KME64_03895 [Scytonematopsis contorta HA4267-MV1]|nr:hypothetical protein [Scytonematopsis contorta HA4267-MV1]
MSSHQGLSATVKSTSRLSNLYERSRNLGLTASVSSPIFYSFSVKVSALDRNFRENSVS